jgi:signal peptidase II
MIMSTPPLSNKDLHVCVTHQILSPAIKFWLTLVDVLLLDTFIKWVISMKPIGPVVTIIPNVLDLYHAENSGVAFGIFSENTVINVPLVVSGLLILTLMVLMLRYPITSTTQALGYGFLLGGGLNNWGDRLLTGEVTDYLYLTFVNFPIFNLSDVLIFIGSVMVMFHVLNDMPQKDQ